MNAPALLRIFVVTLSLYTIHAEVLELSEDEQGTPVWKNGEYRDRNEIPLPSSYDEEKKHKRDTSLDEPVDEENDSDKKADKKNLINRIHFSMPFGVGLPLYHVSKVTGKKGKKSGVPHNYRDSANKLKLDDAYDYAKLDVQTPDRKSEVSKSWGMTYNNLFQEKPKEMTGQMRSKLEAGYKIKEEDLDNGMMFRGLGGLRLRDQNHQIIEGKFADEDADEEMDARSDVTKNTIPEMQRRGLFHYSHLFNHHYHRPHEHHYHVKNQQGKGNHSHRHQQQQQQKQEQPQQQQQK